MQQQPPVFADASSDEVFETNLQGDEFFESGADDHFFFDAADMNPSENETLGDDDGDDRGETDDISVATNSSALLYDRSQLTVSASSVLVLQFKMKHKLTQEALGDLLELLKLHCPSPNKCFQSVYLFTKQFHELKLPVTFHYFCSSCLRIVKTMIEIARTQAVAKTSQHLVLCHHLLKSPLKHNCRSYLNVSMCV